jgi:hypothetical protein
MRQTSDHSTNVQGLYLDTLFIQNPLLLLFGLEYCIIRARDEQCTFHKLEHLVDETVNVLAKGEGGFDGKLQETYMTGALIASTAFHSVQLSGRMAKRVCRIGV